MRLRYLCLGLILVACESSTRDQKSPPSPKAGHQSEIKDERRYSVKTLRNLSYVADKSPGRRRLDLYLPKTNERVPLFVYIHGGAWVTGDKAGYSKIGKGLAKRGIAVAIINYRLSSRSNGIKHPKATMDGAAALCWLHKKAESYGYDAQRLVLGGHSAGAHMTGLLVFDESYLKAFGGSPALIRGAVGIEGIYDLPALVGRWPRYRGQFVERAFGAEAQWAAASPQGKVVSSKRLLPWLVIHSPKDELVDMPQSENFVVALKKQGSPVSFFKDLKESHFGAVRGIGGSKDKVTEELVRFIRSLKAG